MVKRLLIGLVIVATCLFLEGCASYSVPLIPSFWRGETAHTVRPKETLYSISKQHNVSVQSVIEANNLKPPYTLSVGQKLLIRKNKTHTVQKGETLYSISRLYGTDTTTLAKQNGLKAPWTLSIGQTLIVPAQKGTSSPSEKTSTASSSTTATKAQTSSSTKVSKGHIKLPDAPKSSGTFAWPVSGKVISSYGLSSNGKHNDGINISASKGTPIKAAENGIVAYTGNEIKGYGNLILIKHSNGWITAYAHADSILVKKGETVKKGQTIAKVGSTGNVKNPQLHFEIRKGTKAVDPKKYLK